MPPERPRRCANDFVLIYLRWELEEDIGVCFDESASRLPSFASYKTMHTSMNAFRKLALRFSRRLAPLPSVAFRFAAPVMDTDLAGFDVNVNSPPPSDWPFSRLRELGITQYDDHFVILDAEDGFDSAVWILPLKTFPPGMFDVPIWRGGLFTGIAISLQSPNFLGRRSYSRKHVETFLKTIEVFDHQLSTRAELRYDAQPTDLATLCAGVRRELSGWIVD